MPVGPSLSNMHAIGNNKQTNEWEMYGMRCFRLLIMSQQPCIHYARCYLVHCQEQFRWRLLFGLQEVGLTEVQVAKTTQLRS